MKKLKILALMLLVGLLPGCSDYLMICSLNPFYLERDIVLAPGLEGVWKISPVLLTQAGNKYNENDKRDDWKPIDLKSKWRIARKIDHERIKAKSGKDSTVYHARNYYTVSLVPQGKDSVAYQFEMVVFRVKDRLYADFLPVKYTGLDNSRMAMEGYFRMHTLARVDFEGKIPRFSWLGSDSMKEMIEEKRVRVHYRWVPETERLMLTGSSEELAGMISRYAGETRFIDWNNQPAKLFLNSLQ